MLIFLTTLFISNDYFQYFPTSKMSFFKTDPAGFDVSRFERVSCCQLLGFINQSHYLKPEWGQKAVEDASGVKSQYGWWIWAHNPERYSYDNYGKALRSLVDGTPFENTNIPRGYKYQPWSLKDIYETLERGEKLKFEGDWS